MAKFADYNEVVEKLELPINGKTYIIPPVTVQGGARWVEAQSGEEDVQPLTNDEFMHIFLGAAYDDMVTDEVPEKAINRAAQTALANHTAGMEVAEIMWTTGGYPKAIQAYVKAHAPNRASRRSKSTGAATATRSRASTSGTSSRKK